MSLFRNTVDSILSDVTKKIDQLQELAEQEQATARASREAAQRALADASSSELEAERALRIAGKIEELVS